MIGISTLPEVLWFCDSLGVFDYILQKYLDLIYIIELAEIISVFKEKYIQLIRRK